MVKLWSIAGSANGRPTDSESVNLGPSPSPAASKNMKIDNTETIRIVKLDSDNSSNLISQEIKNRIGDKTPDVLIAGIPCQGFSRSNKKRNHLDARNYLFLYFVEMAKSLKPKNIRNLKLKKKKDFS